MSKYISEMRLPYEQYAFKPSRVMYSIGLEPEEWL